MHKRRGFSIVIAMIVASAALMLPAADLELSAGD
jgi:hypothetical protein